MEMDEALSFLYGTANVFLRPPSVSCFCKQDGARARHDAARIVGVIPQVALDGRRGLRVPAEIEERPGDLVIPQRLIGLRRRSPDPPQSLLVSSLVHEAESDASGRAVVPGVD